MTVCYIVHTIFLSVSCSPLTVAHSSNDSSTAQFLAGNTVNYNCDTGYWFSDESKNTQVTCSNSAEWKSGGTVWSEECIGR